MDLVLEILFACMVAQIVGYFIPSLFFFEFLNFILFIYFLYSRFLLVIYFIHISVYMSIPIPSLFLNWFFFLQVL